MKKLHISLFFMIFILFSNSNYGQQNQWKNIGPFMGYVNCMAMDSLHSDTVYAGTTTGVYKSVDGAENWYKTSLTDIEIKNLTISLQSSNFLIASSDSIVFKSEDYGETWNEMWKSEKRIGAIAIDPSDDLSIWVGIHVGDYGYTQNLYHSSNGGNTWESVSFPRDVNSIGEEKEEMKLKYLLSIQFDQSNDSIIYVCGRGDTKQVTGGLFVSKDKGKTWANHKLGNCSSEDILAVATTKEGYEPHAAYILYKNNCSIDGLLLFKSLDYGATWVYCDVGVSLAYYIYQYANLYEPYLMKFDPIYPKWLCFGGYRSGASIVACNIEEEKLYVLTDAPLSSPTSLLINSRGWYMGFKRDGVFRRHDGRDTSWVAKINGMTDVKTYDIMTYPDDPDKILVAIEGRQAKTSDRGQTWSLKNNSFGSLTLNPQDTSIIYGGALSSYLPNSTDYYFGYKSINGGDSWSGYKLFMRIDIYDYGIYFRSGDIVVFPEDPDVILFAVDGPYGAGLFKSIDGGNFWLRKFGTGVDPIAMDPSNNDIVYLGTTKPGSVYKSENRGEGWTSMGDVATTISDLEVDKKGQITAATSEGFYKWDGGTTWSLVPGLPEINTTAIAINNRPTLPVYYVGTEGQGVFVSEDGGSTWDSFNEGLKKLNITKLKLTDSNPRILYAGTEDGGVWVTLLTESENIKTQNIALAAGWNIMSLNINPLNVNMMNILQAPIDEGNLIKVMDESGNSIEDWGIFGGWTNNIGDFIPSKGYKIKVNMNDTLVVSGVSATFPFKIPLKAGWNIIGYPQTTSFDGMDGIVKQLIDKGTLVKVQDESGNSIEDWGIFGGWTNNIGDFFPGEGYKIKVNADDTLWIFESYPKSTTILPQQIATTHFKTEFEGNGIDHMNINLVGLPVNVIKVGDELAIFDGTSCVGAVTIMPHHLNNQAVSIAASASDNSGMVGFGEDNPIMVKLWNAQQNKEFVLEPEIVKGTSTFTKHETTFASVEKYVVTGLEDLIASEQNEIRCYPNPFGNEVTVEINLTEEAKVEVQVLNQLGQQVTFLTSEKLFNNGVHRLTWDGNNGSNQKVSSGIYYVRVMLGSEIYFNKVLYSKFE
jgi:photosystem II stability/assembly factor-like uncharacterized protein